jgi:hypothetical protein
MLCHGLRARSPSVSALSRTTSAGSAGSPADAQPVHTHGVGGRRPRAAEHGRRNRHNRAPAVRRDPGETLGRRRRIRAGTAQPFRSGGALQSRQSRACRDQHLAIDVDFAHGHGIAEDYGPERRDVPRGRLRALASRADELGGDGLIRPDRARGQMARPLFRIHVQLGQPPVKPQTLALRCRAVTIDASSGYSKRSRSLFSNHDARLRGRAAPDSRAAPGWVVARRAVHRVFPGPRCGAARGSSSRRPRRMTG